jgi:hypothetical protein
VVPGWHESAVHDRDESTRRLRTGANSGPTLSITRCAAECDTPNNGPICRIVSSSANTPPRTATTRTSSRN